MIEAAADTEAIKRLKYDYCHYGNVINGKLADVDSFAALFTDTAEWDIGAGLFVGSKAIGDFNRSLALPLAYAIHIVTNPRIDVDGDTASGTWQLILPSGATMDAPPLWQAGTYHETYVRTFEGWRFQSMKLQPQFYPPPPNAN